MNPLPRWLRRLYLGFFLLLFIIILPAVILYANGWRFKSGVGLVKTGAIYIDVPYPDTDVYFNGELIGHTGFLQRNFYVDDLAPSAYVVGTVRNGFRQWGHILVVEPQLVTDSRALHIPEEIVLKQLVTLGEDATSTKVVSTNVMEDYREVFATSTAASSTVPVDVSNDISLFIEKGDVIARWFGGERLPSIFCPRPSFCSKEIIVEKDQGTSIDAYFFGGGVVYVTKEGNIYFTEMDIRPTNVFALLFSSKGAAIRVIDGALIVKSGSALYQVEGL